MDLDMLLFSPDEVCHTRAYYDIIYIATRNKGFMCVCVSGS